VNKVLNQIDRPDHRRQSIIRDVKNALVQARDDVLRTRRILEPSPRWIVTWKQAHANKAGDWLN
jgi:hypothetical protein